MAVSKASQIDLLIDADMPGLDWSTNIAEIGQKGKRAGGQKLKL
jgi:hypothetical protein